VILIKLGSRIEKMETVCDTVTLSSVLLVVGVP